MTQVSKTMIESDQRLWVFERISTWNSLRAGLLRQHDRRLDAILRADDLELVRIAATVNRASALGEDRLKLRGHLLLIFH
jgi:hypothetical protein